MNLITLSLFFIFIFLSFSLYFLIKLAYNKNSLILFDRCKNNIQGCFFMLLQNGLRNFCLGISHLFVSDDKFDKILILSFVESAFIILLTRFLFSNKIIFYDKLLVWNSILISFEQILLNFTFVFLIHSNDSNILIEEVQIILFFINTLILITLNLCFLFCFFKDLISK